MVISVVWVSEPLFGILQSMIIRMPGAVYCFTTIKISFVTMTLRVSDVQSGVSRIECAQKLIQGAKAQCVIKLD
jgi:hypothetical protein